MAREPATGRPDAGSVGNADDKNPPGQSHNPEDNNSGYECDANSGVGVGNPAHTGCTEQQNPTQVPGQPTQVPGQPTKPGEPGKTPSTGAKAQPGATVAVSGMPSTGAGDGTGSGTAFPAMLIAGAALMAGAGIAASRQQRAARR